MAYDIETKLCSKNGWDYPAQALERYGRYNRTGVTIHWWGGGETADKHDSTVNYFMQQAEAGVKSVNYVVSDGKITCMVEPDNVAWCSTKGNPTTISIEHQPTLGDEGYKRSGWLVAQLEKKYGRLEFFKHSYWQNTTCPGTTDLARIRAEADKAAGTASAPLPSAPAIPVPSPAPVAQAAQVFLPSSVQKWRVYDLNVAPVVGNEKTFIWPSKFAPGLTYDIIGRPMPNIVTIQTRDFGQVNIYVGPDTEAQFISGTAPTQVSKPSGNTIFLPTAAGPWRIYKTDVSPRVGNEFTKLRPDLFPPGLEYEILDRPYPNVVTIQTQDFGRVNIYVGPDTEVQFR